MTHIPTTLERIIAANEGITTPEIVFDDINQAIDAEKIEELRLVEHTIARRVKAMLKYVFGVCQEKEDKRPTAQEAMKEMEKVVSRSVAEIVDPQLVMEQIATEDMFEPDVAKALSTMEDVLHAQRNHKELPASEKTTLRELLAKRSSLRRAA